MDLRLAYITAKYKTVRMSRGCRVRLTSVGGRSARSSRSGWATHSGCPRGRTRASRRHAALPTPLALCCSSTCTAERCGSPSTQVWPVPAPRAARREDCTGPRRAAVPERRHRAVVLEFKTQDESQPPAVSGRCSLRETRVRGLHTMARRGAPPDTLGGARSGSRGCSSHCVRRTSASPCGGARLRACLCPVLTAPPSAHWRSVMDGDGLLGGHLASGTLDISTVRGARRRRRSRAAGRPHSHRCRRRGAPAHRVALHDQRWPRARTA
jgi:hypothetical protein